VQGKTTNTYMGMGKSVVKMNPEDYAAKEAKIAALESQVKQFKTAQEAPAAGSMFTAEWNDAAAQAVAKDAKIVSLESQVKQLTTELKAKELATAGLEAAKGESLRLQHEIATVNAEMSDLNDRLSTAEDDLQVRTKELAATGAKLAAEIQLKKDLSAELDATKGRLAEANQRSEDVKQSVADLQTKLDAAEAASGDVPDAVANITTKLTAQGEKLKDAENALVIAEEALAQSDEDARALRAELLNQSAALGNAEAKVKELTTKIDDLVKALAELGAENTALITEKNRNAAALQRGVDLESQMEGVVADLKQARISYDLICVEDGMLKTEVNRLKKEFQTANDRVSNLMTDLNASSSELSGAKRELLAVTTECDNLKQQLEDAGGVVPKPLNAPSTSWIGQKISLRPTPQTAEQDKINQQATATARAQAKEQAKPGTLEKLVTFTGAAMNTFKSVGKLAVTDAAAKKIPPMEMGFMSTKSSARSLMLTDAPNSVKLSPMSSAKSAEAMMTTDNNFDIPPLMKRAQGVCMSVLVAQGRKCAELPTSFTGPKSTKKTMMFTYNGELVWVCRENEQGAPMTASAAGTRVIEVGNVGEMLMKMEDSVLNYQTVQYNEPSHADAVAALRFLVAGHKKSVPEVADLIKAFGVK
jgi:predicted  nucleic acid-binding Zn-ribbon protein